MFKKIGIIILFCCLGIIIYSNTFHNPFSFDDYFSIHKNRTIREGININAVWDFWPTRFITYLTIALNYHFNKYDVFYYHLVNLIIHLSATIAAWLLVGLALRAPRLKGKEITKCGGLFAFFTALIFLVHPVQTQAVTYIIQRTASLAALGYISCIGLYAKARLWHYENDRGPGGKIFYAAAIVMAIIAMFTKEMTITLAPMILVYEVCFFKKEKSVEWKWVAPFFVVSLILPLTMFLTGSVNFKEMHRVAETQPTISSWHYLLTQFNVIVTYIKLLFVPLGQCLDYDYPIFKSIWNLPTLGSLLFLAGIIFIGVKFFPKYRLISFGIFWFFITLLPESSFIPIQDVIFEHRLYLPMLGFAVVVAGAAFYFFKMKNMAIAILAMLIIWYLPMTYIRNFDWEDSITLWKDNIFKAPKKARPHHNLGIAYLKIGKVNWAMFCFNKAIELNPDFFLSYASRGNVYFVKGDLDQAIANYDKAIKLCPVYSAAYYYRGQAYQRKGEYAQGLADYNRAIDIDPNSALLYNRRGYLYYLCGKFDAAIADFNVALELKHDLPSAYFNRAQACFSKGQLTRAILDCHRAIQLAPDNVFYYIKRANIYRCRGDINRALLDYDLAIRLNPEESEPYYQKAVIYFSKKEYDQSWDNVNKAQARGMDVPDDFLKKLKSASQKTGGLSKIIHID